MKITNREFRECEYEGKKEDVLFIDYTHYGKEGQVQIRDVDHIKDDEEALKLIEKQLVKEVRNNYENYKTLKAHEKRIKEKA